MAKNLKTFVGALPIIAKAIGRRYGVKVKIGGSRAFTDGNTITLPSLPADDPEVEVLVNGYLDHEAAHCRFTDFDAERSREPFQNWLEGALEDIRCERGMGQQYPGCRRHLEGLVDKLVRDGVEAPLPDDANEALVLSAYILHRLRYEVLEQQAMEPLSAKATARFEALFPKGLRTRLNATMAEVSDAKSTQDVIGLAARIFGMLKEEAEEPPPSDDSGDSDEDGDPGEGDKTSDGESGSSAEQEDSTDDDDQDNTDSGADSKDGDDSGEDADEDAGPDEDDDADEGDDPDEGESGSGDDADDDDPDEGEPDTTGGDSDEDGDENQDGSDAGDDSDADDAGDRRQRLRDAMDGDEDDMKEEIGNQVASMLEDRAMCSDAQDMAQPSDESGLAGGAGSAPLALGAAIDEAKVRQASARLRSRLAGLMQTETLTQSWRARSGRRIERRALPRLRLADPRVFRAERDEPGVDTAVTVLIDRSGSMAKYHRIVVAREAALAAAYALDEISGVNPSVFAFPGVGGRDDSVVVLHRRGRRVDARSFGVEVAGGTPLTEAAWYAGWDLLAANELRKILVVLTDGQPEKMASAIEVFERMRVSGIETLGIGIGLDISPALMPESRKIDDISELSGALFDLLERKLVTQVAA